VADMSGNTRLAMVMHNLLEQFDRLARYSLQHDHPMNGMDQGLQEHDAIIDAIQAHDPARASRLVYQHAESGRSRIITAIENGAGCRKS
jgi:DNA-binding GntR family transcriptional regulator